MGTIEQHWEDVTIYSVEFISALDPTITRKFQKFLVFPSAIPKEGIVHLVSIYLHGIEEVLNVDELDDGLLLKNGQMSIK